MAIAFLLMWGMLRSLEVTGHGNAECCAPPYIEFAEIIIERITVGSRMRYECEYGYQRKVGGTGLIKCINDTGIIHWTTKNFGCTKVTNATSWQATKKNSSAAGNPVTIVPSDTAGYCGMPRSIEHARPTMTMFAIGQELHYKCLSGYDARPPTSDISICKKGNDGNAFWTNLHLQCTNDSKRREETTEPFWKNLSHETSAVDTSMPSHTPSVKLAVTEVVVPIVLLIVFIILGWLLLQKRWARMRSTPEVKIEKTTPILTAAARVEMESEEEIQRLKSNV